MWGKILKTVLALLPYLPRAVDFLLRKFKIKKVTIMDTKISQVSKIIDDELDFVQISKSKVKNIAVKGLVASIEMFDGSLIEMALTELFSIVPEDKKWIVDKYLDAIIAKNWMVVVDTTTDVLNVFLDVPGADEEEERTALAGVMVLIFKFLKNKASKKK